MGGHVEREFKLELPDEQALARVRHALAAAPARAVRQINHFLDTPAGHLRRARLALRLREEDGRWWLTLKGPRVAAPGALAARAEEERELEPAQAAALLAGERDALACFAQGAHAPVPVLVAARAAVGAAALGPIGSFVNERERLGPLALGALPARLVLELDRTTFPDGEAHELEVELPPGVEPAELERELRALFARLGLPWRPAGNKAARFFRALEAGARPASGSQAGTGRRLGPGDGGAAGRPGPNGESND